MGTLTTWCAPCEAVAMLKQGMDLIEPAADIGGGFLGALVVIALMLFCNWYFGVFLPLDNY